MVYRRQRAVPRKALEFGPNVDNKVIYDNEFIEKKRIEMFLIHSICTLTPSISIGAQTANEFTLTVDASSLRLGRTYKLCVDMDGLEYHFPDRNFNVTATTVMTTVPATNCTCCPIPPEVNLTLGENTTTFTMFENVSTNLTTNAPQ